MNILNIEHIHKIFGDKVIFDDISCGIDQGEKIGIIGVNGTGKTTLLRVIAGEEEPDEGQVITQNGIRISWLPQTPEFPQHMTILDYVAEGKWQKDWSTESEARRMLNTLGITDQNSNMDNLSGGEKKRVALARMLLNPADILILDEPTVGLDPKQILEIRALIRELAQEHTVILSSHILSEVQEVCDHIFIIHHGRLVAQGTPAQLERELTGTPAITLLLKAAPEEGRVLLSGVPGVAEVAPLPCGEAGAALLRLTPAEGADPREAVFRACAGADLPILEMRRESLSLEQIFLELTSDASAAGQAGGRRRPFGRRDSAEPEPAPETAITEHGEEAEP